jgi:hypothetical protein
MYLDRVACETSMSSFDSLGLDDDKGILPTWPQAGKKDPEHAVEWTKPRPWSFPFQDRQLLAQSDVFQL